MLMAGLDGVQNKIHPGDLIDKDMYHLPPEEAAKVPRMRVARGRRSAACATTMLSSRGGVFSEDFLESYVELKEQELTRFRMTTHPVEFDMYYSARADRLGTPIRGQGRDVFYESHLTPNSPAASFRLP